jgi:cytochrome c biogenesis protein CcmG, thiol:disulfide interchange protein DsbE
MTSPAEQANAGDRAGQGNVAWRRGRRLGPVGSIVVGFIVIALAMLLMLRIQMASTQARVAAANRSHAIGTVPPGAMGISLVGETAPDITFTAWTEHPGQQMTLSSLRGHPVVLNIWEASCYPCQLEAPLFKQADDAYQAQGVIFLGVALYTSQADGDAYIRQYGVTYLAGGITTNQTVVDYSVIGIPDTYFINSAGQIVDQNVGQITQQKLTAGIQAALK